MLVNDYGFSPDDVLILCDKRRNYLESRNIKNSVMKMVQNAVGGDQLFLYVTGHGRSSSGRPPAIVTTDLKHITDEFWSQITGKVPLNATLSAIINTCHSGAFFTHACKESEISGQVIVLTACGWDGEFFRHGLCPAAAFAKNLPISKIYQMIRENMQQVGANTPQLYCTEQKLSSKFLQN
ncbi:hypothetical protein OROHE_023633 [Orobanche hederae]